MVETKCLLLANGFGFFTNFSLIYFYNDLYAFEIIGIIHIIHVPVVVDVHV